MSPVAPRQVCKASGCGKLTEGSYCEKHTHKRQISQRERYKQLDAERGTAHSRGYDSRWKRYSASYRRANPLCVMCKRKGLLKAAECVDHIIPVTGSDDPLFWEPSNHQALCTSCHSIKTSAEDGGFGNVKRKDFKNG